MSYKHPLRDSENELNTQEMFRLLHDESGRYLLGNYNRWHGGVHVVINANNNQDNLLNDDSARKIFAIGKGEVVAYRLNSEYKKTTLEIDEEYQDAYQNEARARGDYPAAENDLIRYEEDYVTYPFSSSFCLIKHEYKVKIENDEEEANNAQDSEDEETLLLTFYSFYHHLLPYDKYLSSEDATALQEGNREREIESTEADIEQRETERAQRESNLAQLKKEKRALMRSNQQIERRLSELPGLLEFMQTSSSLPIPDIGEVERLKKIWMKQVYPQIAQLENQLAENNIRLDTLETELSVLNEAKKEDEALSRELERLKRDRERLRSEENRTESRGESRERPKYWGYTGEEEESSDNQSREPVLDSVHICNPPVPISSDDLIGYFGLVTTPTNGLGGNNIKYQLHYEIFTDETELQTFLDNELGLTQDKEYLKISEGTRFHRRAGNGNDQPDLSNAPHFSMDRPLIVPMSDVTETTHNEQMYYHGEYADGEQAIRFWIAKPDEESNQAESSVSTIYQHDWSELGFQMVEESNDSARGFVWDDDIPDVFQAMYRAVMRDESAEASSVEQLMREIRSPQRRHIWSKLVVKHPTEWEVDGDDPEVSEGLDRKLSDEDRNGENLKEHEKERIKELNFWAELGDATPTSNNVYHFHPVAFVDNLKLISDYYIDEDGYIRNAGINRDTIENIERVGLEGPNAIVLHRTFSRTAESTKNGWRNRSNVVGAHFLIDKDGAIDQVVSLHNYANHVGAIRARCKRNNSCPSTYNSLSNGAIHREEIRTKNYPDRYPYNKDSIGIEVVSDCLEERNNGHYAIWEDATEEQLQSIAKLIRILQKEYNLSDEDLYQHQYIAHKTYGEGAGLYSVADSNGNVDDSIFNRI